MRFFLCLLVLLVSFNVHAFSSRELLEEVIYQAELAVEDNPDLDKEMIIMESLKIISDDPRFYQKGFAAEVGRALLGAVVGEIVHRAIERVERPAPSPRPTPPERRDPPSRGTDPHTGGPNPVGCPSAG